MIQIQLLLSKTLHRQLFIVNLPKNMKWEAGRRLPYRFHYHHMSQRDEGARHRENFVGELRRGGYSVEGFFGFFGKLRENPLTKPPEWYIIYKYAGIV